MLIYKSDNSNKNKELNVTEKDRQVLIRIITKYLPKTKIYLFGSRAREDHALESDIDIALDNNNKIESSILSSIREGVEESTIPFTVDIIDLNNVSNDFKKQILKNGKSWH